MNIAIINTCVKEDIDFSFFKVGELSVAERIIKQVSQSNFDKIYILIDINKYKDYKEIIEKNKIDFLVCEEKNIFESIKGYYCLEDSVFIIDSNVFVEDKVVFDNAIEMILEDYVNFRIFDRDDYSCMCVIKGKGARETKLNDNFRFSIKKIFNYNSLKAAEEIVNYNICMKHVNNGVDIMDVNTTYIGENVMIEKGVVIYPNNYIYGNTHIGKKTLIYPNNFIKDSVIGECCEIGPFSNLKNNNIIGDNCIIGAFVEIKNSLLKKCVKAKHHAYLGDVDIDSECNIGCGVIFANYDGKNKHRSKVGKGAFVGSNVTIVSPVNIGERSFLAAGSTIVDDVEDNTLSIARCRQINKKDYYK